MSHATVPVGLGWPPSLTLGPYWASFEQLRKTAGSTAFENIRPGTVATLNGRSGTFRILRDDDFQKLLGLASEVHRIKSGITFIVQAAKVVAKHKDKESVELLVHSVAMLGEFPVLPEREGHGSFEMTEQEIAEFADDSKLDLDKIPRPL